MLTGRAIPAPDAAAAARVQAALDAKTKPPGSLGRIEALAVALGAAQARADPVAEPAHLLIFAGDHGIVAEGVSAWPQAVTGQMVANFASGGAAANVLARAGGVRLSVYDAGIAEPVPGLDAVACAGIRRGTRNAAREDALSVQEVAAALDFGAAAADAAMDDGARVIALGEMGIGNTSTAALLAHAVGGVDLATLAGPGAGLDRDGVAHKYSVLVAAARRRPGPLDPLDALAAFGGLEVAAMVGASIAAASRRGIVVVDGFIGTAAALVATGVRGELAPYLVFSHVSHEPGHRAMLAGLPDSVDARPLLDLDLRLGEGTGALLAIPLLRAAAAIVAEMATFESAGVSGRSD